MHEGTVKLWYDDKGWGFITAKIGGDIFVHYSSIEGESGRRSLLVGETVTFEIRENERGQQAYDVRRASAL